MRSRVVLFYQSDTPLTLRVAHRLRDRFGERRVIRGQTETKIQADDIAVVLLSDDRPHDDTTTITGGWPLSDLEPLSKQAEGALFESDRTTIPILIDDAVMPSHESLSDSVRALTFRHALPLRSGDELDRDMGRLIRDLEVHLRYIPGNVATWDYWLLPFGIIGTLLSSIYAFIWLPDLWSWNFAYTSVQSYRDSRFWLAFFWPALLGLSLLILFLALYIRRYRNCAAQRTAHFHTGTGPCPQHEYWALATASILAWASIGWGWWSGLLAIALVFVAIIRRQRGATCAFSSRKVLTIAVIAGTASLWAIWRSAMMDQFETALQAHERGIAAVRAKQLKQAEGYFQQSIEQFPRFGNAYQGLGLVRIQQDNLEAAHRELSNAIARYPNDGQGLWDGKRDAVVAAYRNRAGVSENLGNSSEAERDHEQAETVEGGFNIFGGFFRWW